MNTSVLNIPATLQELVADPRIGFDPSTAVHFPACDGGSWPEISASEAVPRQQIEFLAVYTHLNRLHAQLRDIRDGGGSDEDTRPVLEALQRVIHFRDQLEDFYAPVGFYAEPLMEGPLAVNLTFHYAQKYVCENHRRDEPVTVSMKVSLPEKHLMEEFASEPGISIETLLADLQWPPRGEKPTPIPKIS